MPDEKMMTAEQPDLYTPAVSDMVSRPETVEQDSEPEHAPLYRIASRVLDIPPLERVYKFQRAVMDLKAPLMRPFYHMTDMELCSDGRKVRARLYTPEQEKGAHLLIFFHGGGWVTESVDSYHHTCQQLASELNCRIISVEYSLAPENRFPVGVEDCFAAAKEIFDTVYSFGHPPEDIVLIGDSAGGNLSAAVSLMARDRKAFTVRRQILLYPATYNDHSPETSPFPSIRENGQDYILTSKRLCEYWELYLSPDDWYDPYAAPLLEKDLSNQPDTLIITAGHDPRRDEGEAYGRALAEAGSRVVINRMEEAIHGFISHPGSPEFSCACQLMRDFLEATEAGSDSLSGGSGELNRIRIEIGEIGEEHPDEKR